MQGKERRQRCLREQRQQGTSRAGSRAGQPGAQSISSKQRLTSCTRAGRYCLSVSLVRRIMYICARATSTCCAATPCARRPQSGGQRQEGRQGGVEESTAACGAAPAVQAACGPPQTQRSPSPAACPSRWRRGPPGWGSRSCVGMRDEGEPVSGRRSAGVGRRHLRRRQLASPHFLRNSDGVPNRPGQAVLNIAQNSPRSFCSGRRLRVSFERRWRRWRRPASAGSCRATAPASNLDGRAGEQQAQLGG